MTKPVLTVGEVADYLHVHQSTIYRMLRRSQLPAFRVGSDWRFDLETIDRWRLGAESRSSRTKMYEPQSALSRPRSVG
jgi:excisionase family DNA binding protein